MAKIELAYSLEYEEVVDAIEANELWIEGILKDKRAFVCTGENCNAGITCRNMDSYPKTRKMIPNFIMSSRENEHNPFCNIIKEWKQEVKEKNKNKGEGELDNISKNVCFHLERPDNHRKIINTILVKNKSVEELNKEKKMARERRKSNNSNFYWLYSLLSYYINAYKENRLDKEKIEIDFGKKKKYAYDLAHLFKRINQQNVEDAKKNNHYIYFGRAIIFSRDDGGYDIVFCEKFLNSDKKVKCVVGKVIIDKCEYGKNNKINLLKKDKNEEKFVYVLSSRNETDNCIFLNIPNLDCIAISEIDLDCLENEN